MSTTTVYGVSGMTCGHCVSAVTAELKELPGVTEVEVDLQAGRVSHVRVVSDAPLDDASVAAAVDDAGYQLAE